MNAVQPLVIIRPVQAEDADELFPLVFGSQVTDTLIWDGPSSFEEYHQGVAERAERVRRGESHLFTIVEAMTGAPVGSIDIRPGSQEGRADIGLWIGAEFHGKGYGTEAVRQIVAYGFEVLGMEKIEACAFVGNHASRRIFEKNGFSLEGTVRKAILKRGLWYDEWLVGITREEYLDRVSE